MPEVDQALLALTGPWYWGTRPYVLRLLPGRSLELSPVAGAGRASRFAPRPDGTWIVARRERSSGPVGQHGGVIAWRGRAQDQAFGG
jgi:hypothetical protein